MKNLLGLLIITTALIVGCKTKKENTSSTTISKEQRKTICPERPSKDEIEKIEFKRKLIQEGFKLGTIIDKTGLDGCGYVFQLNDSTNFEPLNLDSTFMKDRLQVALKYKLSRAMTTCMIGQPISILEIKEIK